jgi:hypothetical protein
MIRGLLCVDCDRPIRGRSESHPKPLKNQSVGHSSANHANSPLSVFNNLHTPAPLNCLLSPAFPSDYALRLQNRGVGVRNFYLLPNQQLTNSHVGTNPSARPVGITHVPAWRPSLNSELSNLDFRRRLSGRLCFQHPHRSLRVSGHCSSFITRHPSPFLCRLEDSTPL